MSGFVTVDTTTGWTWPPMKRDEWHFVQVEGDGRTIRTYVDGVLVSASTSLSPAEPRTAAPAHAPHTDPPARSLPKPGE
jgi:hypothetical protein